jgi:hypothetical protein
VFDDFFSFVIKLQGMKILVTEQIQFMSKVTPTEIHLLAQFELYTENQSMEEDKEKS